jgi:methyl-accepting chemotaxis protein
MTLRAKFENLKLQTKLLLAMLLMMFVMLSISTVLYTLDLRRNYLQSIQWRSEALAQSILYQFHSLSRLQYNEEMLPGLLRAQTLQCQKLFELNQDKNVAHIRIIDAAGVIVAHNDQAFWDQPVQSPQILQHLDTLHTVTIFENAIYHTLVPIIDQDQRHLGVIDVGFPRQAIAGKIQRLFQQVAIVFCLFGLIAVLFSWFLSRRITAPIQAVIKSAVSMSDGDLSHRIQVQGRGEMRQLTQAFRDMADDLRNVVAHMRQASELIQDLTAELLAATDQLAASLEEQSASVMQTSVTMERVVAASQQISQNTQAVVQIAEKTRTDAQHGMNAADAMIEKMQTIQQSNRTDTANIHLLGEQSAEISKILELIASIADRTKLISFNASLEAAGAGSTGRRFGVVAEEIRHLADTVIGSTSAIRKTLLEMQQAIQKLIASSEVSTKSIQEGVEHTVNTANWLKEIVNGAGETTHAAQDISQSTHGQQLASEEISAALKELSLNTTQFAQASALNRDIAGKLNALVDELENVLKVFTL